ncbi:hypothetical protein [Chitinimonas lacunae]|uniref:Uncharacterized protein n=1 Tax=Chitinimonas lacunae TaxID=1963018 RepID=A0ABV8MPL4_9NEIS
MKTKPKTLSICISALLALSAVGAQAQQTMVLDPELGLSTELAQSLPQVGDDVSALYDLYRVALRLSPNKPIPMPKIDVVMKDFRKYSFESHETRARNYHDFIGSAGSWTVRRDGVVVCQACSGHAKLAGDGYWIFVQPEGSTSPSQVWAVQLAGRQE